MIKTAIKALSINKNESWALHSYAHIYEMKGIPEKGIQLLRESEEDWGVIFF